jgi:hypothetical protein
MIIPAVLMASLVVGSAAFAAEAEDEADKNTPLQAEVVEVTGIVKSTTTPDDATSWGDVKLGDKLGKDAWIRTGLGESRCVLKIAGRCQYTVKSASKIGIAQVARKADQTVEAEVGLKYGAVHADVDHTKGKTDMRVRTASAVVALRGSDTHVGNSEMGVGFQQGTGHGQLTYADGLSRMLNPGGQQNSGDKTPSEIVNNALATWLGDVTGGLTPSEQQILNDYFYGGNFNSTLGGVGPIAGSNTSTPSSLLSSYLPTAEVEYWRGSGSSVPPGTGTFTTGEDYGVWSGSGIFRLSSGQTGSWVGGGPWMQAPGEQYAESFKGAGDWTSGSKTGSFIIDGKAGYPYAAVTMDHNTGAWTAEGWSNAATIISVTDSQTSQVTGSTRTGGTTDSTGGSSAIGNTETTGGMMRTVLR